MNDIPLVVRPRGSHPRDYPLNAEALTRFRAAHRAAIDAPVTYTTVNAHLIATQFPETFEADWCWEEIAQLNAVIAWQRQRLAASTETSK